MLYLSESLQVTCPSHSEEEIFTVPQEKSHTAALPDLKDQQEEAETGALVKPLAAQSMSAEPAGVEPLAQGPTKPKKDKFARLRELGLDPPPVAKLSADDGAFVQLELPQLNPGEL